MKVLVTGKNGLVGAALQQVGSSSIHQMVFVGREEAGLTKECEVEALFRLIKPDWVVHTAAKVGGIGGNIKEPAAYFYQNILMNSFIIHYAWKYGVKKLLAFSSVCVFPDGIPLLKESLMLQGEPYHTQFAYACAKRAIDIQIRAYKKQYGIQNYCSVIPGNIFGKFDYYNLDSAHVVPSLIHKIHKAKKLGQPLKVWGDGTPKREFIYSEDLAKIILNLLELEEIPERILISNDKQITIREIVGKLCIAAKFTGRVEWETDKPNGQLVRPSDLSLLRSLIGNPSYTNVEDALTESYNWFEEHYAKARK